MPEEACAFVCAILGALCAVCSWGTVETGDWGGMIVVAFYAAAIVLISGYVLVHKYLL